MARTGTWSASWGNGPIQPLTVAYRVTAERVVVLVPVQQFIGGKQLRQQVIIKRGLLLPDGVEAAVIESLLDNGLIHVDDAADEFERLFRHDPPVGHEAADAYNKLFNQSIGSTDDGGDLGEFGKLLPPWAHGAAEPASEPDEPPLSDDERSILWRVVWRAGRRRRAVRV